MNANDMLISAVRAKLTDAMLGVKQCQRNHATEAQASHWVGRMEAYKVVLYDMLGQKEDMAQTLQPSKGL